MTAVEYRSSTRPQAKIGLLPTGHHDYWETVAEAMGFPIVRI